MRLYKTTEAAEYLGMSEAGVRNHVYNSKRLRPRLEGGSLVFTEEQLDRFIAEGPRQSGRKKRET